MIIKDYEHLIGLQHIHMKQMLLKYVKVKWFLKMWKWNVRGKNNIKYNITTINIKNDQLW